MSYPFKKKNQYLALYILETWIRDNQESESTIGTSCLKGRVYLVVVGKRDQAADCLKMSLARMWKKLYIFVKVSWKWKKGKNVNWVYTMIQSQKSYLKMISLLFILIFIIYLQNFRETDSIFFKRRKTAFHFLSTSCGKILILDIIDTGLILVGAGS